MEQQTKITTIAEEIADAVNRWFDQIGKKDAGEIVRRTTLQIGIHDYLRFEYKDGRIRLYSYDDDFGSPEVEEQGSRWTEPLTKEAIESGLLPQLQERLLQRITRYASNPLLNYRFTVLGKFTLEDGEFVVPVADYVDEGKKAQLLQHLDSYIHNKLRNGQYPTKPLETFFLSNHLVDPGLYPNVDAAGILSLYERVIELNKSNKEKLAEHRATFIRALSQWTETVFLPRHFDCRKEQWGLPVYTMKAIGEQTPADPQEMELALNTAILIIKHEPNYSRQSGLDLLERLKELGSDKAERIMNEGSGTMDAADVGYRDELVECRANDVFSTVTVQIKTECADSYAKAIDFICNLLEKGFSKSYRIKLKSKAKHVLPVPGLDKSQTHRFFANALQYAELCPRLETYAKLAIAEYEWYDDTEDEPCCMPGTYAVFGLGLADRRYFPLIESYMRCVDEEHQSVQTAFTLTFVKQYGIDDSTIPTVAACLLKCTEGRFAKQLAKERALFETEAVLQALAAVVQGMEPYEAEHLVDIVWGGADKLQARIRKEKGELAPLLASILSFTDKKRRLP